MQEKVYIKATDGKWKFFIIEPAEKMTILSTADIHRTPAFHMPNTL